MHSSTAGCDPVCVEHRIPQHGARMPLIPAIRAARASILVLRNACCTTTRPTRKFTHDQVLSECPASALVSHSKICSVRVPHLTKRALQDARRVVSSGVSVAFLLRSGGASHCCCRTASTWQPSQQLMWCGWSFCRPQSSTSESNTCTCCTGFRV